MFLTDTEEKILFGGHLLVPPGKIWKLLTSVLFFDQQVLVRYDIEDEEEEEEQGVIQAVT